MRRREDTLGVVELVFDAAREQGKEGSETEKNGHIVRFHL